jgi:hypothetical protein
MSPMVHVHNRDNSLVPRRFWNEFTGTLSFDDDASHPADSRGDEVDHSGLSSSGTRWSAKRHRERCSGWRWADRHSPNIAAASKIFAHRKSPNVKDEPSLAPIRRSRGTRRPSNEKWGELSGEIELSESPRKSQRATSSSKRARCVYRVRREANERKRAVFGSRISAQLNVASQNPLV